VAGKLGHDVSSQPRLAFRLGKKTVLPTSTNPKTKVDSVLPANPAAPSRAIASSVLPTMASEKSSWPLIDGGGQSLKIG
jgi:hypothetical protein